MRKKLLVTYLEQTSQTIADHATTGGKMRALREKTGISGRKLALQIGVSSAYLSDLENGKRNWTEKKCADYLAAIEAIKKA